MKTKERIAIIGAGAVGTALGVCLHRKGYSSLSVASRSYSSAKLAAQRIGKKVRAFRNPSQAARGATLILITTPDSEIERVCLRLIRDKGIAPKTLILHTSGFFSSKILNSAKRRGAFVGSLHPLQSFAEVSLAIRHLPGSYFGWEGGPEARSRILQIIRACRGTAIEIQPESKPLYHAAAVLVSNYTVALFSEGVRLFDRARVQKKHKTNSQKALLPLLQGTCANLAAVGLPRALTGPIARGDVKVVREQIRAIARGAEEFLPLYLLLGMKAVEIARRKGTLAANQSSQLARILKFR